MAKARTETGRRLGWKSKATETQALDEIMGYAGEYAVSLILNRDILNPVSESLESLRSGDVGERVEVKTRKESNPRLWDLAVNVDQLHLNRIYFLCLGYLWPDYIVAAGWAMGGEIKAQGRIFKHNYSGHNFYIYDRDKLHKVKEIYDYHF